MTAQELIDQLKRQDPRERVVVIIDETEVEVERIRRDTTTGRPCIVIHE